MDQDQPEASKLAVNSWILFDWAGQPFYTLITTFLFAPYFANIVVGNPTEGQAIWGYAAAAMGVLVALISPLLGAVSDASGRRKPWILFFFIIQILAMSALWYAKPGDASIIIPIMAAFIIAGISAEFAIVFTNAMMPDLVSKEKLGRLSGTAFAVGYAGGLVALIIMSGFLIASPETGKTMLSLDPLISFDISQREGERFVGPFCALWYALFAIPFFLFTPDLKGASQPLGKAVKEGMASLSNTFVGLGNYKNVVLFLVSRMLYIDGLTAIFTFGGIYAASIFSWGAFELGLFGILLAATGAIGAYLGGKLDDKIGAKNVILISLVFLLFAVVGLISIDKTHIFFVVEVPASLNNAAVFGSIGERVYLAFAVVVGLVFGPVYSSSRTLMVHISPKEKMTEFFGFFAFSGKVTAFLAPLAIGLTTTYANDQRIGISVITLFLLFGLILLIGVKQKTDES